MSRILEKNITRTLASAAVLLSSVAACHAATLVHYDFDNGDEFELAPEFKHPAIEQLELRLQSGTLRNYAGTEGRALGATGFAVGNAVNWQILAAFGHLLVIDRIEFDLRASASGPKLWWLELNGEELARGPIGTAFGHVSVPLSNPELSLGSSFALQLNAAMADSNQGTFRLDNFSIGGAATVVPLPSAAALLVCAGGLLLGRRERLD